MTSAPVCEIDRIELINCFDALEGEGFFENYNTVMLILNYSGH